MNRVAAVAGAVVMGVLSLAFSPAAARDLGYGGDLTQGIPPMDAGFQAQAAIHENGLWFGYVATDDAEALPLLFAYRLALEAAGWTARASGGGNPFGSSGGGQISAEHTDGRYLRLNAGHPGVQHLDHAPSVATFIDACVWPQAPDDDSCNPSRWIDTDGADAGAPHVGATDLAVGIPQPAVSEYRSEDILPEGGRHYHYISAASNFALFQDYLRMLSEGGWTITDATTRGDLAGGGGTAWATDGSRYVTVSVGGAGTLAHFDACVWLSEPSEPRCPRTGSD